MHHLLSTLNPPQQQAVTLPNTHALILAGAGSGKTRVLVHRLGWLIQEGLSPHHILAVTFTNKAAQELRSRIESLFNLSTQGLWVGTFHGLAHKILRLHCQSLGLSEAFQILDADDQTRLLKRVIQQLNIDDERLTPKIAAQFVNHHKEEGRRAQALGAPKDFLERRLQDIYQTYEQQCRQSSLVDFAELLLAVTELFDQHPDIKTQYQTLFRHILVDEFQDTNTLQYRWIKQLSHPNHHVMVVGDDDQSIYGWRGAKVENIRKFEAEFCPQIIRLEQNYRSSKMILNAANALIAHNRNRMGKSLWSEGEMGAPLQLYSAFNEIDEARFIVHTFRSHHQQGLSYAEMAILYRSNAQSRVLEEALIQYQIPYRVYGGMRFFERTEIKDALAYLRLVFNPQDDAAFERVINLPARGLGDKALQALRDLAHTHQSSLWQALAQALSHNTLPTRTIPAFLQFLTLIQALQKNTESLDLPRQLEHIITETQLLMHYQKEGREVLETRQENLSELISAAEQFAETEREATLEDLQEPIPLIAQFLTHTVLEAGERGATPDQDAVQLMTLHAAKGLEFPVVVLSGMEDELFPGHRSQDQENVLEEERRLCYVGITRAMRHCYLTYSEYRRWYGESKRHSPSRFLRELPSSSLQRVAVQSQASQGQRPVLARATHPQRPLSPSTHTSTGVNFNGKLWRIGQSVQHPKFGEGVILQYEGQGESARVQVQFQGLGSKWLVLGYASLTTLPSEG